MKQTFTILIGILVATSLGCDLSSSSKKFSFQNGDSNNLQPLIDDLSRDSLIEKKTYQEVPLFLRHFLDSLTGEFSIANPGEEWQCCCSPPTIIDYTTAKIKVDKITGDTSISYLAKDTIVPSMQLKYFGIGTRTALLKYYAGGIGVLEHIVIFAVDKNSVTDFWSGNGRFFKEDATKEDIVNFLIENKGYWRLGHDRL